MVHLYCNLLILYVLVLQAIGVPVNKRPETGSSRNVDGLSSKLSRLKLLLQELQTGDDEAQIEKLKETTTTVTLPEVTTHISKAKQPIEDTSSSEDVDSLNTFLDSLSPTELLELKDLKTKIDQERKNEANLADKNTAGTFSENEIEDIDEGSADKGLQKLAARYQPGRNKFYQQKRLQDSSNDHVNAHTEEGSFGTFREEVKYSVEKNLLSDIALAMHSGISLDEIIHDLIPESHKSAM